MKSGFWLDYGGCLAQPDVFDLALAARAHELSNVGIRSSLAAKPRAVLECDPEGSHFHYYTWHFSAYERAKSDAGICYHMPPNLGEIDDYYRRFIDPIDIVVLKVRPAECEGILQFRSDECVVQSPRRTREDADRRDIDSRSVCLWRGQRHSHQRGRLHHRRR